MAKLQARAWLSIHFARLANTLANTLLKTKKVNETIMFLLVTLPNIYTFKKSFTDRLSNKPILICLFTIPPHLK